jgi:hypothetical protein
VLPLSINIRIFVQTGIMNKESFKSLTVWTNTSSRFGYNSNTYENGHVQINANHMFITLTDGTDTNTVKIRVIQLNDIERYNITT